jgi:Transglutaminase-like superfamily
MLILRKIRTFFSLDSKTMTLLMEAFLFLGWARLLKTFPFNKIAPKLGNYMEDTSTENDISKIALLKNISFSIHIMSKFTFWESKCLVRAIAAMKMLNRRHLPSTLYLGTANDKNGKLIAHAWLRSGSYFVTGKEEMNNFTIVGKFANHINRGKIKEI